jgi:hypothetical protein
MLEHCCRDFLPFSHKSISEVRHWCWAIRPGSQLAFQLIQKVFNGVEVRALCRPVKFLHTDLDKTFLYGPRFVHEGIVIQKQERGFPKLLPRSTESFRMSSAADHYSSSTKLYSCHYALGQVAFSWHPPNPDSSVGLPDVEAWFITLENAFPQLQSPMAVSFTPL